MLISVSTAIKVDALIHEYHTSTASQNLSLLCFACATIAKTCKILYKLHSAGIEHRQISTRSIRVLYSNSCKRMKVKTIDFFDLSIAFSKKDTKNSKDSTSAEQGFLSARNYTS